MKPLTNKLQDYFTNKELGLAFGPIGFDWIGFGKIFYQLDFSERLRVLNKFILIKRKCQNFISDVELKIATQKIKEFILDETNKK